MESYVPRPNAPVMSRSIFSTSSGLPALAVMRSRTNFAVPLADSSTRTNAICGFETLAAR